MSNKKYTIARLCMISMLFLAKDMHAQISNCNTFLKNNYLEVGMNWNGAFGSSTPPPAGFHHDTLNSFYGCGGVRTSDSALGFVADPDKNGWSTGSPSYYGDYILPGAHQEGWSIMAAGSQVNLWNSQAGDSSVLPGGVTYTNDFRAGPSGDTSIWTGTYNGLQITQYTMLDTGKLFFKVLVYIDNTGLMETDNIYYMRTIKASPEALQPGGSYVTKNKIEHVLPDSLKRTIVLSASPTHANAYLAMGTRNPNASAFIIKRAATPYFNTIDNIAAGTDSNYLYAANDSLINNSGIGLVFNLGNITSGGEDTLSFIYAFTPQALGQSLSIPYDTVAVSHVGINQVANIHYTIYPNPAGNLFTVTGMEQTDKITLYDELGRNVTASIVKTVHNTYTITGLVPGLYMAIISDESGNIKWKSSLQKN